MPDAACTTLTSDGAGTANQVAKFSAPCNLEPSAIVESGGNVGIGTTAPAANLDVNGTAAMRGTLTMHPRGAATSAAGADSYPVDLMASSFDSTVSSAITQHFRWQAEPAGNDTANPGGALSLLYASGSGAPAETGLSIGNTGLLTFTAQQTFPGTGSVTSVGSGAGLTGGPITSSGTLGIASGGVSNAMLANPSLTVKAGTDLTGGGRVALGGSTTLNLDTAEVPQLNSANTFTGNQTVNGVVSGTQFVSSVATGAAPLVVGSTTQVKNLNASLLGGFSAGNFQPVGAYATLGANAFTGNQSVTGNVTATGTLQGGV